MKIAKSLGYLKYRLKYRYAPILNLAAPVDVSLELSSNCNMACRYCYHADPKSLPFERGFMSLDLAKKVIKESAEIGVHSIKTNFRGESTLNPHFAEITEYAKLLASGSTLIDRITNSNFKFPTEKESVFLGLCNQTKVKVSFDSFQKDVLETQRKGAKYDLILSNIDKFYNHPLRRNTLLVVQAVRTTLNKDEDLQGEIKRRWPTAQVSIRDMVAGRVESETVKTLEHKSRDASHRQACIQAFARLMVHWDGKVAMCCPDIGGKIIIGDANKEHLYDIFNSTKAKAVRKSLKDKTAFEQDPCRNCSSFETFKGYKAPFHA